MKYMTPTRLIVFPLLLAIPLLWGCGGKPPRAKAKPIDPDLVAWEEQSPPSLEEIEFQDSEGKPVTLQQYRGKKNVVLVITRGYQTEGYSTSVCLYCATQTSRLMANYEEFRQRNAEVLVVFPVENEKQIRGSAELLNSAKQQLPKPLDQPPFPVWIDLGLKAVKHLGIEQHLAKPATYVLDGVRAGP